MVFPLRNPIYCAVYMTPLGFVLFVVDLFPMEYRTMLEDFSLLLLTITAHAQWDYGW